MLNCHQEFSILLSELVGLFLKLDSCRNGWVPPCLTNTGITVRFVCGIKLTLPCHGFVMSYSPFAHCLDIFIFKILLSVQTWADANCMYSRGGSRIFFRRGCTRLLLYFNTNKPHSFFFCRIPVVLENRRSSQGGGVRTPCSLPLDPPLYSGPGCSNVG